MIKVGIFWAVPDGKGGQSVLYVSKLCERSEADSRGFINYDKSHLEVWDEVRGNRTDDCYYYPRGRVIFDVNEDRHIIYADECVDLESEEEIVYLFDIDGFIMRRDEHYVCPKCQKKEIKNERIGKKRNI